MSKRMSLQNFIIENNLDPEMNNPMEWYRPKEFFLNRYWKLVLCHVFEFIDSTGEKLYIIDNLDAPHSTLKTQTEFESMSDGHKVFED